jgi:hypothetical protein
LEAFGYCVEKAVRVPSGTFTVEEPLVVDPVVVDPVVEEPVVFVAVPFIAESVPETVVESAVFPDPSVAL